MLTKFFLIFALCIMTSARDSETMEWSESNQLSWADFKGTIDSTSNAAAVTASGITFSFSVRQLNGEITDFDTQIHAHFYPENSWFIASRCNNHILKHEQLHFDITELYARIFRYRIAQLQVSPDINAQLKTIHKNVNQELSEMQEAYDAQTNNSINKEAQLKWNAYVAENLEKFNAFKS